MTILKSNIGQVTSYACDTKMRAPENTLLPPYCFVGQLESLFPDKSCVRGTATLIKTVSPADEGLYAITSAANLYDTGYGGEAVEVSFRPGLNEDNANWRTPIAVEKCSYPDEFPDVNVPNVIDRTLVKTSLLRANDEMNYGLIKLSRKMPVSVLPRLTACTDVELINQQIVLVGLYGLLPNSNAMGIVNTEISSIRKSKLKFGLRNKKFSGGTPVFSSSHQVIGIHGYQDAAGSHRHCARRITQNVIDQIISWQK